MRRRLFAIAVCLLAFAPAAWAADVDACVAAVPHELVSRLRSDFPSFRAVRASDYSADSLAYPKAHGIACPGIAIAKIGGRQYMALFVVDDRDAHTLLVAAHRARKNGWRTESLSNFGNEGASRLYVEPIKAGRYTDLFASDRAPDDYVDEPGRVRHYASRNQGFLAGKMESSGAAYFYTGKRWIHLWLSD